MLPRFGVHCSPSILAFTLIEVSIVLVIIGLLAAGIFVGKDLIEAARIRSLIAERERILLAANNFQLKYNCLAGDCLDASSLGFNTLSGLPNSGNGDGDGIIGEGAITAYNRGKIESDESINFFAHLGQANFLDGFMWPIQNNQHYKSKVANKCSWYVAQSLAGGSNLLDGFYTWPSGTQLVLLGPLSSTPANEQRRYVFV